ncbi:LysM peptidoglycan-binding domain-containing protein [Kingella potus]|uniref:LysM peptidoglycan-binding domain-containing protein n=1 Tax=Kingella potus TaxID=265175 RepID=UPI001FD051CC|nr:LysM peptidoglycan-binding domain-containing protein [Kingella potus]UOP01112.1 LysM peptidoglycan-binding domain-containing protein [Kingella potus]
MNTRFPFFPFASCAAALVLAACASSAPSGGYYRVQRGDTLNRIAARFGQSPATLAKWNNLSDPSKIAVGQRLRVGRSANAVEARKPAAESAAKQGGTVAPTNKLHFSPPSPNPVIARFGGGNKGIDFAGQAGDPVRAAGRGGWPMSATACAATAIWC